MLEKLLEDYITTSAPKEGVMAQVLTDVDGCGTAEDAVCLLGGVIGEFILIASTLEALADDADLGNFVSQIVDWSNPKVSGYGVVFHVSSMKKC